MIAKINCEFDDGWLNSEPEKKYYRCSIQNLDITEEEKLKFIGKHQKGKTVDDVEHIKFSKCTFNKVPKGLVETFPNIKNFVIYDTNLKVITKDDLVEYKHLEKIWIISNQIEFLPGDLFEGFNNLEWISFWGNKISVIEPNILDGLDKLTFVDFRANPNHTKFYSTYKCYGPNATLEEVKVELKDVYATKGVPSILILLKNSLNPLSKKDEKLYLSSTDIDKEIQQSKQQDQNLSIAETKFNQQLNELESKFTQQLQDAEQKLFQEFKESNAKLNQEIQELKNSESELMQQVKKLKDSETKLTKQLEAAESKITQQMEISKETESKSINMKQDFNIVISNAEKEIQQLKNSESKLSQKIQCLQMKDSELDLARKVRELKETESESVRKIQQLNDSEKKLLQHVQLLQESSSKSIEEIQNLKFSESKLMQQVQRLKDSEVELNKKLESADSKIKQKLKTMQDSEMKFVNEIQQLKDLKQNLSQQVQQLQNSSKNSDKEFIKLKETESKLKQQVQALEESRDKLIQELNISESKRVEQMKKSQNCEKKLIKKFHDLKKSCLGTAMEMRKLINSDPNLSHQFEGATAESWERIKLKLEEIFQRKCEDFDEFNETPICADLAKHLCGLGLDEDFKIVIDEKVYRIHKHLFAAKCSTFARFLDKNPQAQTYEIKDISHEIFAIIFEFIYKDKCFVGTDVDLIDLFIACSNLNILKLKDFAKIKMCKIINSENVLEMLQLGDKLKYQGLIETTFKEMKE